GTLVHAVLADAELCQGCNVQTIVERHAQRQLELPDGASAEAIRLVDAFLASPLAAELGRAAESYRELDFVLRWPLGLARGGILLTGTIDRLYRDSAGSWHLVDFKTNKVTKSTLKSMS